MLWGEPFDLAGGCFGSASGLTDPALDEPHSFMRPALGGTGLPVLFLGAFQLLGELAHALPGVVRLARGLVRRVAGRCRVLLGSPQLLFRRRGFLPGPASAGCAAVRPLLHARAGQQAGAPGRLSSRSCAPSSSWCARRSPSPS
ncbi:hypothetical protein StrepF001_09635 [Streptomyces sp. F001]|nr:hypothetical protein StrepF001_09635 [Streptomyces sp. F001]